MAQDSFPIRNVDHVRFYVGNAKQASYYYQNVFGFDITGFAGLETGQKHEVNYLLQQGSIKFLMSAPVRPGHPYAEALARHGDGVQDISFEVDDVDWSFKTAVERGAKPAKEPWTLRDENGSVRLASIHTYGDTVHTFINRDDFAGHFMPGFRKLDIKGQTTGLQEVDHFVGNVEEGKMDEWVEFYKKVLGFAQLVHLRRQGHQHGVLRADVEGGAERHRPDQVPDQRAGRQARRSRRSRNTCTSTAAPACSTSPWRPTTSSTRCGRMRHNDVSFLRVPKTYYELLPERVGAIDEDIDELADLGILVDRDDEGYMLQIFTKPVQDRPTLFFEVIQRRGSRSFGKGNFKALFEAIEREQALRGTL